MKEQIYKIGIFLFSICFVFFIIRSEYRNENIKEELRLYFQVGEEVIQTWENNGIHYLFLPSFASTKEVILAPYSLEFFVLDKGEKIKKNETISNMIQEQNINCQLVKSGKKFQLCIFQSENIPALFIDTKSGGVEELKADKEYVVSGTIKAVDEKGKEQEKIAIRSIGGRGNTSFMGYEKKPFSITLNTPYSLLNLPVGQKYALISNASDPSLIRNDIARRMEMAMELPYSHAGRFVDLYVNGEYQGNYYLCDDIEIGAERIDIQDMEAAMDLIYQNANYESEKVYETDTIKARQIPVDPVDITGGYLMEREYVQRFEYEYPKISSAFITNEQEHFVMKSPRYCSVNQIEYIQQYVNEAEEAMLSPDGIHPETGKNYQEYIDMESFVKKYLVEEVSKNYDAGVTSSYYYKDSQQNGGKLCAGPGWDYDMSMGNYVDWMEEFSADPTGISELAFHTYASLWYTALYHKAEFYDLVEEHYETMVKPFLQELVNHGLEEYEKNLQASAKMNEIRWKEELKENPYYRNREQTFAELKEFIALRKAYLDEVWIVDE